MANFIAISCVVLLGIHSSRGQDSCSDLQYYNPSDVYTASDIVTYGHYLSDKDFCRDKSYLNEIMTVPIVIASIYVFMLLCFLAGMSGRVHYHVFKCRPPKDDNIEYQKQKSINLTLFYILCCLVLILDQLVFVGNFRVDESIKTLSGATTSVKDRTHAMKSDSQDLYDLTGTLTAEYNATLQTCSGPGTNVSLSYLEGNISAYSTAMNVYTNAVTPISDFLHDVDDDIQEYGVLYRSIALYIIWALAVLLIFALLHYNRIEFRYGLKLTMGIGVVIYALYALLSFPWTYSTSLLADFCISPSYNAVKSLPVRDSLQSIGIYYSTCRGNCTLTNNYDIAQDSVRWLNETVASLRQGQCANSTSLLDMQSTLVTAQISLDSLSVAMQCGPTQKQWFRFWNSGVCNDLYAGSFYIWGSQLLTSFFLFILIVCVSVTYQFYADTTQVYPLASKSQDSRPGTEPLYGHVGGGGARRGNSAVGDMMSAEEDPESNLNRVLRFHEEEADGDETVFL